MVNDTKMFKLQTEESDNEDNKIDNFDFQKPKLIRDQRHVNSKLTAAKMNKPVVQKQKMTNSKSISTI